MGKAGEARLPKIEILGKPPSLKKYKKRRY
jgi:hypothetical protein